jgi:hypothetical protein
MGTFKALVGLLAIVLVVVALFQVLPPIMANFSFTDDLRQVAMMAGANPTRTDDDVRNDVLRKAKEHDLPIDEKQVTVLQPTTLYPSTCQVTPSSCTSIHQAAISKQ